MILTRRRFLEVSAANAALVLAACDNSLEELLSAPADQATLLARPHGPTEKPLIGFSAIGNSTDGFFYVPPTYAPDTPSPLLVLLHGGGGSPDNFKSLPLSSLADPHRLI